ncbi:hypothetical protein L5515_011756 [Caenorhabditis briggsae]|uniref:Uncharacterized protein n=1 Tax=Caenorhabditis briggsae TaxID=6238 RepID=A0AAE9JFZ5_CAEBR|nr:hypothetical protein L3Y34_004653 [Caenorhabditis briggsae]UMM29357.1 hypothetical protein L5515_011756 [Caenorhabditis briggsae]
MCITRSLTYLALLAVANASTASDPIDSISSQGADILNRAKLTGQTVRQCSCTEQRVCVEEMKIQAKDCTVPCFQKFSSITSRPNDLKKCFDEKDNILEDFLTCFENRVEACVADQHGPQIQKTDIRGIFKVTEKSIATQTNTFQTMIKPIKHILDATGDFALCVKDCFLEKNKSGFCFDRKGCQPLVAETKARQSFRACTKKMHWKREAGELCECSVNAGVDSRELRQYCAMFKLMGRRAPMRKSRG